MESTMQKFMTVFHQNQLIDDEKLNQLNIFFENNNFHQVYKNIVDHVWEQKVDECLNILRDEGSYLSVNEIEDIKKLWTIDDDNSVNNDIQDIDLNSCDNTTMDEQLDELLQWIDVSNEEVLKEDKNASSEVQLASENIERDTEFTHQEIQEIIDRGGNLYKEVPGNLLPKDDSRRYSDYQLYRAIDAWASDFIVESQNADWKVYTFLAFKISGFIEIQDKTPMIKNKLISSDENFRFFQEVRKYLWTNLAWVVSDKTSINHDGSFSLEYKDYMRDFRYNSYPTVLYDKKPVPRICIRITSDANKVRLKDIYMLPFLKRKYQNLANDLEAGASIFTWWTWEWKTHTTYGVMNDISKDLAISSIENPIESKMHWVNQVQPNDSLVEREKDRFSVTDAMKWVLRQNFDVVAVAEMRDETEIQEWMHVALLWTKLLTTLHTNSAYEAFLRLRDAWVDRTTVANAINNITWQRLVRRVCKCCAKKDPDSKKKLLSIRRMFERAERFVSAEWKKLVMSLNEEQISDFTEIYYKVTEDFVYFNKEDAKLFIEKLENLYETIQDVTDMEERRWLILDVIKWFPYPDDREAFYKDIDKGQLYIANKQGCENCYQWYWKESRDGVYPRVGIYEWVTVDEPLRNYLQDINNNLTDMKKFDTRRWFIDMKMYGYLLSAMWITTMEEVDSKLGL